MVGLTPVDRGVLDQFNVQHAPAISKRVYLDKVEGVGEKHFEVVERQPESLTEYAYHRLTEFSESFQELRRAQGSGTAPDKMTEASAFRAAQLVYADYKKDYAKLSLFTRVVNALLAAIGLRHSTEAIERVFQSIQSLKGDDAPRLGSSLQGIPPEHIEDRRLMHRKPAAKDYGKMALSKGPFDAAVKPKEKEIRDAADNEVPRPSATVLAIRIAKMKEEVAKQVYHDHITANIDAGYYDPAIIPADIDKLLGKAPPVDLVANRSAMRNMLSREVDKYLADGKLNEHQAHHLKHDALSVADRYLRVFPDKSCRDGFMFVRDLIRVATYQEYYDKSSFNGSDHGSKHIHHNIMNAFSLHDGMKKGKDYNEKDKFVEQLVHFYHDIGYSVGLAATDFDCCKDHPFIGAKMIESNRDYFLHYLDETCYDTLHNSVLCHAIMNPDLSAGEEVGGMHPKMVRAVTSISDACAVTYDRKTQEFWEQPKALVALARLKTFLVLYPQYKQKLGDDIVKGQWPDFDENNPWDVLAWDTFQNTKRELLEMVANYPIAPEKRVLFQQAIEQQFNAFKANVTLGQYGAVLAKVTAVPNEITEQGNPDYIPEFHMAPSIIYGVLKDLFGADQANDAFEKLVKEFHGDMGLLKAELDQIGTDLAKGKAPASKRIQTGAAIFRLMRRFDHDSRDLHQKELQRNLKLALGQIQGAFKGQKATMEARAAVAKELDDWNKAGEKYAKRTGPPPVPGTLGEFLTEKLLPRLGASPAREQDAAIIEAQTKILQEYHANVMLSDTKARAAINTLIMVMISEEEYSFMRGSQPDTVPRAKLLGQ